MLSFWQTIQVALRLPHAKLSAAMMVIGPVLAFLIPVVIPEKRISNFLLMVIVFVTSIFIERFCAYVKAVRMEDMRRSGKETGYKAPAKKRTKKR